ncbi:1-deoxy-D-xylulose-5-phosphate synthase [Bovifimicola ammoniilytica]|uniref:1-deoxy-D-xylulose-5-phosphate synthase n=1 Tax=Bovifimicola ammoniilytica TaxID=2981720 RepID=UPI000821EB1D|nr:1-deoxy-D-xylulose-5-phosphate synthase [Bovifimicola ammoniilytica]MCU6754428.1 1-deoxy-D-xylulose-5-phosphate synthase [Bovifimicola ammoniilytica]SCJ85319.1 1-deoxy-D-xylulose-5-phosphate synthase [uncultured Eubacterium sp.]
MVLDKINKVNDIKDIPKEEYDELADEIRNFLIEVISKNGGHLASNLGVVELTMALHLALDLPEDKIIFDVGHQSYTHKILTGRKEGFDELRSYGGMSGFPKRRENECDCFDTGHSSTSISAGLGIVTANEIMRKKGTVVSVIGDGALSGGMAYEGLNNAARLKRNFIIILNDNNMSISENVGGMSTYLSNLRAGEAYNELKNGVVDVLNKIPAIGGKLVTKIRKTKSSIKQLVIPGMLFEDMGITYLGPVDGHNINQLVKIISEAKKLDHAVLIHVITKKGKGYIPAEKHPSSFHGVEPFNIQTGLPLTKKEKPTYTDVFAKGIVKLAKEDEAVAAITAAMPDGTGLKKFMQTYPERFFDVGIAEEHAVTYAAGLAAAGMKPYVAIYSSFLQRAYDQILHDVCIQDLPVIFMVDRAGLVGADGETHQGIFDLSYLSNIPNMNIFAPKNRYELAAVIEYSRNFNHPLAIRYPRGTAYDGLKEFNSPIEYGKSEIIYKEKDIALLAVGSMVEVAIEIREALKEKGYSVSLVNARFVKPVDEKLLENLNENHRLIVTMEENVLNGGFGERVLRITRDMNLKYKVINIAIPNVYVEHGNIEILKSEIGLDKETILNKIQKNIDMD